MSTLYSAKFYDGERAVSYAATLTLHDQHLAVETENGTSIWRYEHIEIPEKPDGTHPLTLTHQEHPDAQLVVDHSALYTVLKPKLPKKNQPRVHIHLSLPTLSGFGVLAVVACFALYHSFPLLTSWLADHIPQRLEKALGEKIDTAFLSNKTRCTHAEGQAALEQITARLATVAGIHDQVRVIAVHTENILSIDSINAFALPGGTIVLLDGLLKFVESPEEIAGVLAHEIGHLAKRHPTKQAVHVFGSSILLSALIGDTTGTTAGAVAATLLNSGYSRALEEEADQLAFTYLAAAHIDAQRLRDFFKRLSLKEDSSFFSNSTALSYFSSHPESSMRFQAIPTSSATFAPVLSSSQWRAVQTMCASAPSGTSTHRVNF